MDNENVIYQDFLRKVWPVVATGFGVYCIDRFLNSEQYYRLVMKLAKLQGAGSCGDAGLGDGDQYYETLNTIAPVLSLPIQMRCKIWAFLSIEELRILRLVCGRLQCDVDMMVGVHVILDSRSPCFQWVKHIAVQSCFVKALEIPPDWEVFAKPNLLKRMELSRDFSTGEDFLKSIICVFDNLEELSFHMDPTVEEGDGFPVDQLESFLSSLESNRLDGLTIEMILDSWSLKWTAFFRKMTINIPKYGSEFFSQQLSHFFLSLPTITSEHQKFWLKVLNNQKNVKTMNVNLGDVHWLTYKSIVQTNSKSLKKVFLCQIGFTVTEDPFDFGIFQDCHHLQVLGVSCESVFLTTYLNGQCLPTSIINLEKVPHEELQGLLLAYINLAESDLKLINSEEWGSAIKRGMLLNCSVNKSCIPTMTLKKIQFDTSSVGYYPLLGESLEENYDPNHEPDIIACGTAIKTGMQTLFETSNVLEDWATPIAVFFWVAFC